ncbi:hypothetical protein C241_11123 [Bradyrhizobium lupini HPC(L)]|uniref:Uncharacterized protein n=1 Tax=Bradyrhizobium lupini HPC(L) TaxID=1229491 RepID=A0ABN0HLK5_RHILU|nr:hypothetical protein C241_11123 [Bradyrhizobium lupini HPC(L)]
MQRLDAKSRNDARDDDGKPVTRIASTKAAEQRAKAPARSMPTVVNVWGLSPMGLTVTITINRRSDQATYFGNLFVIMTSH